MRVLIDTGVFLSILLDEPAAGRAAAIIEKFRGGAVVSVITLAEVLAVGYRRAEEEAVKAVALIEYLIGKQNVLPVTRETAELAGKLKVKYSAGRAPLSLADALILATAITSGCEALVTLDTEFKQVRELRIVYP